MLYEPTPVVISNVVITDNGDYTLTVAWNTNVPAYGKIDYRGPYDSRLLDGSAMSNDRQDACPTFYRKKVAQASSLYLEFNCFLKSVLSCSAVVGVKSKCARQDSTARAALFFLRSRGKTVTTISANF